MTKEEELDWLCRLRSEIYVYMPREWLVPMNDALDMAVNALKQEPCEDAISRKAVLDATVKKNSVWNAITNASGENLEEIINSLPSVTPTREHGEWTDEVIEKQGNKLIECMTTEAYKIARGNIDKARKIMAGKISEEEEKQLIFGADMRKESE